MQAALLVKYLEIKPTVLHNLLVNNGMSTFDSIVDAEEMKLLKFKERSNTTLVTHLTLPAMKLNPCHVDDEHVDNDVGAHTGDGHGGNMLHNMFATKVLALHDVLDKGVIASIENSVKSYWEVVKYSTRFRSMLAEKLQGVHAFKLLDEMEHKRLLNDKEFMQALTFRSPEIGSIINDLFFEWQVTNEGTIDMDFGDRRAHRHSRRRNVQQHKSEITNDVNIPWRSEIERDPDFSKFRDTLFKIVLENKEALGLTLFEWPLSTQSIDDIFKFDWWASVHEGPVNHAEHVHPESYLAGMVPSQSRKIKDKMHI